MVQMPMSISRFLGVWLLVIVAACCHAAVPTAQLEVSPIPLEDGGKIQFRAIQTEFQQLNAKNNIGQSDHFQIYSVPGTGTYDEVYRLFSYELFVKDVRSNQWLHFDLKAESAGQFSDQVRDLAFTITEGARAERGVMRLPLHSLSSDQYINAPIAGMVLDVRLGTVWSIPLKVENRLKEMSIVIQSVGLTYPQPEFWSTPAASLSTDITVPEQGTVALDGLQVRPDAARVIQNAFFKFKNDPDTQLKVNIRYAAEAGGKPKDLPIEIKVRFVPTLLYLFIAILGGAVLGATARLVDQKHRTSARAWLVACMTAILSAVLLELLGIVLVSLNSEFKLFGITLDPFQFPQVLLMAALIGVFGGTISEMIGQGIGKGGPNQVRRQSAEAPGGNK